MIFFFFFQLYGMFKFMTRFTHIPEKQKQTNDDDDDDDANADTFAWPDLSVFDFYTKL